MDRLHTMARFDYTEPPLPEVIGKCEHCGSEIVEGDAVLFDNRFDLYFCDEECLREDLKEHMDDEIYYFIDLLIEHDLVLPTFAEKGR